MVNARVKSTDQPVTLLFLEFPPEIPHEFRIQIQFLQSQCRHEVLTLQRLRHPNILSVVTPLNDSRLALTFSIKPVQNLLQCNYSRKLSTTVLSAVLSDLSLVEIKSGIVDIAMALDFLHNRKHTIEITLLDRRCFNDT